MAKKTDLETMKKIKKLSTVINDRSIEQTLQTDENNSKKNKKNINNKADKKIKTKKFKTVEVIGLIVITLIVGLTLGGTLTYKILDNKGQRVESELQNFINNYQYIIDNYNGDIDKEELLDAALEGMLTTLDKNSTFLDSNAAKNFNIFLEGSYKGIGIEVYNNEKGQITINRVFANSPAAKAGLKAKDIITNINGQTINSLTTTDFAQLINKTKNQKIPLTYIRNGKQYKTTVIVSNINLQSVSSKTYNQNNKKTGYIQISIFASNTYEQFKKQFEKMKDKQVDSLIIDLRDNSGGYLSTAENIISLFLDSSHPIYQIQKQGITTKYYSKGNKNQKMKIVVLVNNTSASASEILASALMEQSGAIIVGEKTYGKGTVQELQNLPSGDKYKLTTKNWLTSKGSWIDKKGIEPNIKVSLSKKYNQNPSEENDNQLQAAIREATK